MSSHLYWNEKDVLVHIEAAGEQIQTTLGHPFFVIGKGWVKAGELESGNVLKLYGGKEAEIESISIKESKPVTTYNIEVEDYHTYYVTQSDILCHNACNTPDLYRGGNNMNVRARDVEMIDDLVQPTRGVSVNSNSEAVKSFGKPHKVGKLPKGLKIKHTSGTHYEIIPERAMPLGEYQSLLDLISLTS